MNTTQTEHPIGFDLDLGLTHCRFVGIIDRIEHDASGRAIVIDWKTTARPSEYVNQRRLGTQADLYAEALVRDGQEVGRIEYRVIATPLIKMCSKDADAKAYQARCLKWLCTEPSRMQTVEITPTPTRRRDAVQWLLAVVSQIQHAHATGVWPACEYSCNAYGHECEYLPLCLAVRTTGATGLAVQREANYQDKSHVTAPNSISHSGATTFGICPQKYFWRYVENIEPKRDTGSASAWIGSAAHVALDALAKGEDAAKAVRVWAKKHPVIGEDATRIKEQNVARALAICEAAALKWRSL